MNVWFVTPAHGRNEIAAVCFAQRAAMLAELSAAGVEAHGLVVAEDENVAAARSCGLETLRRPNVPLGARWNDGYEHALMMGADFVVPIGSDDWLDAELVLAWLVRAEELGDRLGRTLVASRGFAAVAPDASEIALMRVPYAGGIGVRVHSRALLERVGGRPCEESRGRALDASVTRRLRASGPLEFAYVEVDELAIVDFKSPAGEQLNTYEACMPYAQDRAADPWEMLSERYPAALVEQMAEVYARRMVAA